MNRFKVILNPYTVDIDVDINADNMVHKTPVILFYKGTEIVASVPESSVVIKTN